MSLPSGMGIWNYCVGGGESVYVVGAREIRREVSSRRNDHGQDKGRPFFLRRKKKYGKKQKNSRTGILTII